MKEKWKTIDGYPKYRVSNFGRVLSLCKYGTDRRFLKPVYHKDGYLFVHLCYKGTNKIIDIHRLVGQYFCDNKFNKPQINHKDGNKENNRVDNLEWVTSKENIAHATYVLGCYQSKNVKINKVIADKIRAEYKPRIVTIKYLANKFKVSMPTIRRVLSNTCWV